MLITAKETYLILEYSGLGKVVKVEACGVHSTHSELKQNRHFHLGEENEAVIPENSDDQERKMSLEADTAK